MRKQNTKTKIEVEPNTVFTLSISAMAASVATSAIMIGITLGCDSFLDQSEEAELSNNG